jgi:hypothetical protein
MPEKYDVHRLVIDNFRILEQVPKIIEEIQAEVFAAIDLRIENFAKIEMWDGVFHFLEDETAFKPKHWENDENGNYLNYFSLDYIEDDNDDNYLLSPLLGASKHKLGFKLIVSNETIASLTGQNNKLGQAKKKYLSSNPTMKHLEKVGFYLMREYIFLPVKLDATVLASSYPASISDSLLPIDEALKKISNPTPYFDSILGLSRP